MDSKSDKLTRNDLMTKAAAKHRIDKGRMHNMLLIWKSPEEANKVLGSDSRDRYDKYYLTNTFAEFDALLKTNDSKKDDLWNDLQKGHLTLATNPEQVAAEKKWKDAGEVDRMG